MKKQEVIVKKVLAYLKGYKKECICAPLFKMLEATFELFGAARYGGSDRYRYRKR